MRKILILVALHGDLDHVEQMSGGRIVDAAMDHGAIDHAEGLLASVGSGNVADIDQLADGLALPIVVIAAEVAAHGGGAALNAVSLGVDTGADRSGHRGGGIPPLVRLVVE